MPHSKLIKTKGLSVRISGTTGNLAILADGSLIRLDKEGSLKSDCFLNLTEIRCPIEESATITALKELILSISKKSKPSISQLEIVTGVQMLMGCVWSYLNYGRKVKFNDLTTFFQKFKMSIKFILMKIAC